MTGAVPLSDFPGLGLAGRTEVRLDARTRAIFNTHHVAVKPGFLLFTAIVPAKPERYRGRFLLARAEPMRVLHLKLTVDRAGNPRQWLWAEGNLPLEQSLLRPRNAWKACRPIVEAPRDMH